jgi:deoxyribodipyrimidine photo-lyase
VSRAIVWFRRDLSLVDNLAWAAATTDHREVVPVHVLDRRLVDAAGPFRRRQHLAFVGALAAQLRGAGGDLTIVPGDPVDAIGQLARDNGCDTVVWNRDVTRYAQARDAAVEQQLRGAGIGVEHEWSTLVHPPGSITTGSGHVHRVFGAFHRRWRELPIPGVATAGDARVLAVEGDPLPDLDGDAPLAPEPAAVRARVDAWLRRVDAYADEHDRPDRDATSHLSADLRFGTLSPRELVRRVGHATPGRSAFVRQLAWRDWFAHLFHERPHLVDRAQQPMYDAIEWRNDAADVAAWKEGRTGYPIVDAGMRELAATGWMHNRVRMITASFLVKDLLVDWRVGERHFRHMLIDGDVPQNAGNWQWVAGTGPDAAPYFRVLNPLTQAERFDPDGDYVRRWVPALARLPGPTVHAPWKLGPLDRAAAGVVLGDTYPEPIVDHAAARERAIAAYAAARS